MTRRHLSLAILAPWAVALTVVGALLMRAHWVPLPRPELTDAEWVERVRIEPDPDGRVTAVHLLNADCPCSVRVLRYLAGRSPEPWCRERVVWVTDSETSPDHLPVGYEVQVMTAAEAVRVYGIAAAPVLVAYAPDGTPRYSGGYTARKQGLDYHDRDILARVRDGETPEPLAVYGCPIDPSP